MLHNRHHKQSRTQPRFVLIPTGVSSEGINCHLVPRPPPDPPDPPRSPQISWQGLVMRSAEMRDGARQADY